MKYLLTTSIVFILMLFTAKLYAQQTSFQLEFYNSAGDDAVGVVQNGLGNYVVAGHSSLSGNYDAVISEVSPLGVLIQSKTLTTTANELLKSIALTSDGGYFITGSVFTSPSNYDWLLIKMDSAFNVIFYKQYGTNGNDYANRGFEISPGRYTVTGTVALGGSAKPSVVTVNDSGIVVQEGYLTTNQFASPDYRGHYLGDGTIAMSHLTNAITLMDTTGAIIKQYAVSTGIYSSDIIRSSTKEYMSISVDNYGAPNGSTLSLAIMDSTLNSYTGGTKFSAGGKDIVPVEILQDASGDFIIVANAYDFQSGNYIPLLIRTTINGTLLWSKSYKGTAVVSAKFNAIAATADGNYVACGNIGPWNNQHMFLVKIDSSGSGSCNTSAFNLTTGSPTPQTSTTHAAYTGTLPSLIASSYAAAAGTPIPALICITTAVEEAKPSKQFELHPTWISEGFRISGATSEPLLLRVMDVRGQLLFSGTYHTNEWIGMEAFPAACYIVSIEGLSTGINQQVKVIKM